MSRLRIRPESPLLAAKLVNALEAAECLVERLDAATLAVVHRAATDEREARIELAFFLKAWSYETGAEVALLD